MLEPEAGALLARAGIHAAFETFTAAGGRFDVAAARPGAEGGDRLDAVRSDDGREWPADAFVFACGPWLGRLFPDVVGEILRVTKQDVVYLGTPAGDARYRAEALPVWSEFDAPFYGIPTIDGGAFKVARDGYGPLFDPTDGERLISPESLAAVRDQLQRRFPRLADAPVVESRVCQYESTADTHFIIDRHPGWSNAWIVGGGSGHAFKHGPSIGGYVVGLLAGRTPEELEGTDAMRFRLGRRSPGLGMRAGHTPELAVAATR
jgi:glycine/D-amino acid oxidase-like deaminating enzyme